MRARAASGAAVFVGFMGAGKTSVGREVARRLGAEFIDLDERIEAAAGRSVAEIFASEGEEAFRRLEREAVRDAVSAPGRVLAVGGGAFVDPANRRLLSGYAPVFHLDVSPEAVRERLCGDRSRPLLPADVKRIRDLMAKRAVFYAEADFRIDASRPVEEIASEVEAILRGGGRRGKD